MRLEGELSTKVTRLQLLPRVLVSAEITTTPSTVVETELELFMAELGTTRPVRDVLDTEGDFLCYGYE